MPATYYIHIGLQWKVGDHTTLHTPKTTEQHLIARSDKSVAYRPHSIILAT